MKHFILLKISIITVALSITASEKINAQVEWQNPLPIGCWINSVCYSDTSTIHAATDYGNILKSTDNGETWVTNKLNTNENFVSIQFLSNQIGFAASERQLYKTSDGGNSWESKGNALSFNITWAHFFDENTGIISGYGKIVKTDNGGISWNTVYENQNDYYNSGSFVNDSTGYIVGMWTDGNNSYHFCLKTIDGGSTWIRYTNNSPFGYNFNSTISFINADTGFWAISYEILKTVNGGISWEIIKSCEYETSFIGCFDNILYAASDQGEINRSVNEGLTWQKIRNPDGSWINKIICNNNKLFCTAFGNDYHFPVTIKSYDTGSTWETNYPITQKKLFSVSFCDSLNGFACGEDHTLLHTSDGGKHWEIKTVQEYIDLYISVYCINPSTAYCLNNNGWIYKTIDSGNNWINKYLYFHNLKDVCFINLSKGFCVGENGVILITNDEGESWTEIFSGTLETLYEIDFINENVGYIAGGSGIVLKTVDGGYTWQLSDLQTNYGFSTISFIDENVGFVSGRELYKTIDGGNNWEKLLFLNDDVFDMIFTDENHGYVASPLCLKYTVDGGHNWKIFNPGPYSVFHGIEITNNGSCYLVGFYGTILHFPNIADHLTDNYRIIENNGISIYPNPTNNIVLIDPGISSSAYLQLDLFDLNGKLIISRIINSSDIYKLATKNLPVGTYIVRLSSANQVKTSKLIIAR